MSIDQTADFDSDPENYNLLSKYLNEHLGQLVDFGEPAFSKLKFDKVYEYPQQVGIIVDNMS